MTRKVGVIGSGNVGSTLANNMLVAGTADTLVLIDTNELKLNSDATPILRTRRPICQLIPQWCATTMKPWPMQMSS